MLESTIQAMVRQAVAEHGSGLLWRNNVGAFKTNTGGYVTFGLAPGSADLVGLQRVELPCPHCGAHLPPVGRFFAIETKQEKPHTRNAGVSDDQETWGNVVREYGGVTGVARSYEDAVRLVEKVRRW